MSKILKIIAWLIGIVVIVIAAAAIAIPLFFDPNDYKQQITDTVKDKTGRELVIKGDIGLSVFPWLGVDLGTVEFSNAPGFGAEPFARVEAAQIRVKLVPLFKKQLEMDTLVLKGMALRLSKDKSGKTNWADLLSEEKDEEEAFDLASLAISGVKVSDSSLVWDDQSTGKNYTLDKLNLTTGALALGEDFDFSLDSDLVSTSPAASGHIELSGTGTLDTEPQKGTVKLDKIKLSMDAPAPGQKRHIEFSSAGNINLASNAYEFPDTRITVTLEGKDLPGGKSVLELGSDISANLNEQTVKLTKLTLKGMGLSASGELQGSQILDAPKISGPLTVAAFSPRELMKSLGSKVPDTADAAVLSKATLSTELNATAQQLSLEKLALKLDDTSVNGSLGVKDFAKPAIIFDLKIDQIDLDRYLPPVKKTDEKQAGSPASAAAGASQLVPVDTLRKLNAQGTLRIGKLKAQNVHSSDVVITLGARDGMIKLHPLGAKLYEGTYQGNVGVDVRGKSPLFSLNESFTGVQAGPFLKDYLNKDTLSGKATVSAKLTAQGNTTDQVVKTLNGQTAFTFTNGAIKGFNLAKLIRDAQAKLKGQTAAADNEPNQTDFSELRGTGIFTNGVLHNEDLEAKSPLLRITGKGDINLPQESMDYLASATIVASLSGQGGKGLDELKGLTIPVRISGPFSNLSYRPDVQAMVGDAVKAKVDEKIEEKKEELKGKVEEQLQDKLKGLLKKN